MSLTFSKNDLAILKDSQNVINEANKTKKIKKVAKILKEQKVVDDVLNEITNWKHLAGLITEDEIVEVDNDGQSPTTATGTQSNPLNPNTIMNFRNNTGQPNQQNKAAGAMLQKLNNNQPLVGYEIDNAIDYITKVVTKDPSVGSFNISDPRTISTVASYLYTLAVSINSQGSQYAQGEDSLVAVLGTMSKAGLLKNPKMKQAFDTAQDVIIVKAVNTQTLDALATIAESDKNKINTAKNNLQNPNQQNPNQPTTAPQEPNPYQPQPAPTAPEPEKPTNESTYFGSEGDLLSEISNWQILAGTKERLED